MVPRQTANQVVRLTRATLPTESTRAPLFFYPPKYRLKFFNFSVFHHLAALSMDEEYYYPECNLEMGATASCGSGL